MTRVFALLAAAFFLLGCQQAPADAQLTDNERDEVRQIVREYIISNPEIIEEALIELQRRARDREMMSFYTAIEANHERGSVQSAPVTAKERQKKIAEDG